ncbi:DUF2863 family protein [Glaciimonas soli]|uniref:DUF2863 family protein n=1 Tax=Glaciimonas soli TaxID=2590999 RepID=A0A843YHB2_9BURK|nr:DUF2863 family protein [Glaciimonas soli]MQQ99078.1 DUF2863 family protein [Glaciimonas soli]
MRRPTKSTSRKPSADSQRLTALAHALTEASSRLELRAWEDELDIHVNKLLKANQQDPIDSALELLFPDQADAYNALMDGIEACSESTIIDYEGVSYDALLVALPILAWTRFSIASGPIPADLLITLNAHFHAHVLASGVRTALMPNLYAIDQLPRTHADTAALLQTMAHAALSNSALHRPAKQPETAPFLADTRYLLAALVVPRGAPLFNWQTGAGTKDSALRLWQAQATPTFNRLLPGCGIDVLLPEAYFVACREADKQIRPISLRAASFYLTSTLNVASTELHATIGRFSEEPESGRVDEYRIAFAIAENHDVVYGVVWPLYGQEEANEETGDAASSTEDPEAQTPLEQILALLRENGISHIQCHNELFAMEFCDDCGTPLYADNDGELVHPEMPEDTPPSSAHFH